MTPHPRRWRWAANLATLANGLLGVGAIAYVLAGNKLFALFLIVGGMGFDGLDGLFSRRSSIPGGVVGRVADSVSDAITFCVAPALAVAVNTYDRGVWKPLDPWAWGIAAVVLTLGLARLVWYTWRGHSRDHFRGASTPQNALLVVFLVPLFQVPGFLGEQPTLFLLWVLAFAPLMVLPLPYPKIRRGTPLRGVTGGISGAAAVALLVVIFRPAPGTLPYLVAEAATLVGLALLLAFYALGPFTSGSRTPAATDASHAGPG